MDHIPDHLLIDECKNRYIVLELITRYEFEECIQTILTNEEWKEIKENVNNDFYELIGDMFDDYVHALLRDIRVRNHNKNKNLN